MWRNEKVGRIWLSPPFRKGRADLAQSALIAFFRRRLIFLFLKDTSFHVQPLPPYGG